MKKILFLTLFIANFLGTFAQNTVHVTYVENDTVFPNPGRGFYHADDQLNPETIATYPEEGITLVLREYHIDDFKDTALPVWYLWNIQRDFDNIRNAGLKVVLRFRYTAKTTKPYGDAPLNIVLKHIKQLEPVLRQNKDVIFTFQAGFIGAWGEWYYTDYFSESPGTITEQNWIDRRAVVDALLETLPPEIMVNVRTPDYKIHLLDEDGYYPVTEEEAYKNLPVARISHHNDCFLANVSDMGTYTDTAVQKPYLAEDTKYTVIGGETCSQSGYSHCENALKELKRFHWSYLNRDYHQGVISDWINEGCYPEIQKKLGYRFRLISGDFTQTSNPGGTFLFKLKLINDGFANPVNPMKAEIILKGKNNQKEYIANLKGDLRFWPLGDTINLDLVFGLPELIEPDNYELFFRIIDANGRLNDNPSYSIQMANEGIWQPETGYNKLNHLLSVSNTVTSYYNGADFFTVKNKTLPYPPVFQVDGKDTEWDSYPVIYQNHNQSTKTLKAWNTADSLFILIKGSGMGEETTYFVDADNNPESGNNGFDYKITCCNLYYDNAGEWNEIEGVVPDYAANDSVKELAVALKNLNQVSLKDIYGLQVLSGSDYLPDLNSAPAAVIKNKISSVPYVKVQNRGNTNTVFWNRNVEDKEGFIKLYRTDQESETKTLLGIFPNNIISFYDKQVDPSKTFKYTASYISGNYCSETGGFEQEITAESDVQEYIYIKLDGNPDDWKLCKPVATGLIKAPRLQSVRFFNTSDSLFYSIQMENDTIHSYQLYFNIDGTMGFEYKISNDTLYANQNDTWTFQNMIPSYDSEGFLEAGLKLSQLGFDTIDYLEAVAYINKKEVWGNGEEFPFMKYETMLPPEHFDLKVSLEMPYHRIKIKWLYDSNPDEYVLERSVDDSLHFTVLVKLPNNHSYYLDDDVDSSHVYYYRMYSHKDIIRSPYTGTMWMKPGFAGINNNFYNSGNLTVFPQPAKTKLFVKIRLNTPDKVEVSLLSIEGKKIKSIYNGYIINEKILGFLCGNIAPGIYVLKVSGKNTFMADKIVIK